MKTPLPLPPMNLWLRIAFTILGIAAGLAASSALPLWAAAKLGNDKLCPVQISQDPLDEFLSFFFKEAMGSPPRQRSWRPDLTESPSPYAKAHASARAEFEPVVDLAQKSTIRIWQGRRPVALGTVVAKGGIALTKASELDPRLPIECELPDGELVRATVVKKFDRHDLAAIRVDTEDLMPIAWAGNPVEAGNLVASPNAVKGVLSAGVISVPPRSVSNSEKGFLGVGLKVAKGKVAIESIVRGESAHRAGILPGDIISSVDGQNVSTVQDAIRRIAKRQPGDTLDLRIIRNSKEQSIPVNLGSRKGYAAFYERLDQTARLGVNLSARRTEFPSVLQHDMPIEPNECGGPAVDLEGYAVGINISRSGRVRGYAIPAETILKEILPALR